MPTRSRNARVDRLRAEKSFYLDEFRGRTLCISNRSNGTEDLGEVVDVVKELVANGSRIVLILGEPTRRSISVSSLRNRLRRALITRETRRLFPLRAGKPSLAGLIERFDANELTRPMTALWDALRRAPVFVAIVPDSRLLDFGRSITARLRIQKWVILDSGGGINSANGTSISFMDESMLTEVLRAGAAEWAGLDRRRNTLGAVRGALRDGVPAVNLCAHDELATELFTYEGAGTLFTLEDYCRIERLGIDDFAEVERLLERGQREGFLKGRNQDEVAAILLNGFGATIGANHLAGVCGLITEPYRRAKAGEIAGLYTITRFKSEGIGGRLLRYALDQARATPLRFVFACTTVPHAAEFFKRHGFIEVGTSDVPSAKWKGYGSERRKRVTVLRHDLEQPEIHK